MKIRRATKKDLKELAPLFRKETYQKPYNEKWTVQGSLKKVAIYLKENIVFVAEQDSRMVGFAVGHTYLFHDGMNGFIDEFFVAKDYRGKGIESALLKSIEKYFKKKGVVAISLGTFKKARACKFYKKLGYKPENYEILWKKVKK
jgi:GNAT superfamily N-acetyltransferase